MDREEFEKKMLKDDATASKEEVKMVIGDMLKSETPRTNCIICMEELAELQQEISKKLRNKHNVYGLLEEMADVYICLEMLKKMFSYTDNEIARAVKIKLDRFERRNEKHD